MSKFYVVTDAAGRAVQCETSLTKAKAGAKEFGTGTRVSLVECTVNMDTVRRLLGGCAPDALPLFLVKGGRCRPLTVDDQEEHEDDDPRSMGWVDDRGRP